MGICNLHHNEPKITPKINKSMSICVTQQDTVNQNRDNIDKLLRIIESSPSVVREGFQMWALIFSWQGENRHTLLVFNPGLTSLNHSVVCCCHPNLHLPILWRLKEVNVDSSSRFPPCPSHAYKLDSALVFSDCKNSDFASHAVSS